MPNFISIRIFERFFKENLNFIINLFQIKHFSFENGGLSAKSSRNIGKKRSGPICQALVVTFNYARKFPSRKSMFKNLGNFYLKIRIKLVRWKIMKKDRILTAIFSVDAKIFDSPFITFLNIYLWKYTTYLKMSENGTEKCQKIHNLKSPDLISRLVSAFFSILAIIITSWSGFKNSK